ncbi:MAG: hypothetical protein ACLQNE_02160 [Thermoguttaceae bacterium]
MSVEDKFFAGTRLFELACLFTTAGIREDFPYADDQQVQEILKDRLVLARRLEQSQ